MLILTICEPYWKSPIVTRVRAVDRTTTYREYETQYGYRMETHATLEITHEDGTNESYSLWPTTEVAVYHERDAKAPTANPANSPEHTS